MILIYISFSIVVQKRRMSSAAQPKTSTVNQKIENVHLKRNAAYETVYLDEVVYDQPLWTMTVYLDIYICHKVPHITFQLHCSCSLYVKCANDWRFMLTNLILASYYYLRFALMHNIFDFHNLLWHKWKRYSKAHSWPSNQFGIMVDL